MRIKHFFVFICFIIFAYSAGTMHYSGESNSQKQMNKSLLEIRRIDIDETHSLYKVTPIGIDELDLMLSDCFDECNQVLDEYVETPITFVPVKEEGYFTIGVVRTTTNADQVDKYLISWMVHRYTKVSGDNNLNLNFSSN